jgi:UDP-glucose 4-epimerase
MAKAGVEMGHEITVFDNLSTGYRENIEGLGVHLVEGDVRDAAQLLQATRGMDGVFHLAASVGNLKSIEYPLQDMEINYGGTLNVLEAVRHNKVPVLVYSSTGAGYGEPVRIPVDEEHPFQPDSPYGVSKIAGEKAALAYAKIYGFRVACLRYFNAYGVNQRFDAYGNVIPIFATRLLNGQPLTVFGDGLQTRDFVNAFDIARANWLAATDPALAGFYNVATGQQTSLNELIDSLRAASGIEPEVVYKPFRVGEVKHSVADIAKFAAATGYQPSVSLRDGLAAYWKWFSSIHQPA